MGCVEQTFSGLAGMEALIVAATSEYSRNNRCGKLIGQGYKLDNAVKKAEMVVEGVNAIPAVMKLTKKYRVGMPLVTMADAAINKKIGLLS